MFTFVLTVHFILCAILVGLVLIQQGKGADMGAAFGAGGSNSLFGAGGATSIIVKITTGSAIAFMITSILLINLSGSDTGLASSWSSAPKAPLSNSVMKDFPSHTETTAAAKPEQANSEEVVKSEQPIEANSANEETGKPDAQDESVRK